MSLGGVGGTVVSKPQRSNRFVRIWVYRVGELSYITPYILLTSSSPCVSLAIVAKSLLILSTLDITSGALSTGGVFKLVGRFLGRSEVIRPPGPTASGSFSSLSVSIVNLKPEAIALSPILF